jgi:hypothetical protein
MEFAAAVLIILPIFLAISLTISGVDRKLRRLERKVDAIVEHLGIAMYEGEFQRVDMLLNQGNKIKAIKLYREITGVGLAEAKEAVERRAPHQ